MQCVSNVAPKGAFSTGVSPESIIDTFTIRNITLDASKKTNEKPVLWVTFQPCVAQPQPSISRIPAMQTLRRAIQKAAAQDATVRFVVKNPAMSDPIFLRQCVYAVVEHGITHLTVDADGACPETMQTAGIATDLKAFFQNTIEIVAAPSPGNSENNPCGNDIPFEPGPAEWLYV